MCFIMSMYVAAGAPSVSDSEIQIVHNLYTCLSPRSVVQASGFSTSLKNIAGAPVDLIWSINAAICCADGAASVLMLGMTVPITEKPYRSAK